MPDGTLPEPGGWNRFSIEVDDLEGTVARLRAAGVRFRNDIVTGVGGKQILIEDPSGNPVELFEPTRAEARLHDPRAADPGTRRIRCDRSGGSSPHWSIPQTRRIRATKARPMPGW